jgi:hypothetical protein
MSYEVKKEMLKMTHAEIISVIYFIAKITIFFFIPFSILGVWKLIDLLILLFSC